MVLRDSEDTDEELKILFNKLDANKDGRICLNDLMNVQKLMTGLNKEKLFLNYSEVISKINIFYRFF